MIKIGTFSKLSRISIRMLRHYNELGLLVPEEIDDFTGYRYYNEKQLPLAERIQALKDMGFKLSVIKEILDSYGDPKEMERFLLVKKKEIEAESEELINRLRLIDNTILHLRKGGNIMEYQVTLKTVPERYVASVRQVIPNYAEEGMLWNILMTETKDMNIHYNDPCYTMAIFHDKEFKDSNVDVEIQQAVVGKYSDTEHVKFKTEASIEIASATYKGSYEQIGEVNEAVANWVVSNGYEFGGTSFSIYHVSPNETQNPDEYVTEICYPILKK